MAYLEVTDMPLFISEFLPSFKNIFLVFLVVSLALLAFLVHFPKNSYQPSVQILKPPIPKTLPIKDPIFKKGCYNYAKIVATNTCCKMVKYDFPAIEQCLKAFNATHKWVGLSLRLKWGLLYGHMRPDCYNCARPDLIDFHYADVHIHRNKCIFTCLGIHIYCADRKINVYFFYRSIDKHLFLCI